MQGSASAGSLERGQREASRSKSAALVALLGGAAAPSSAPSLRPCAPGLQRPPRSPKGVQVLGEEEKIYDLYFLDEVLQEHGNGGKVVTCRPKSAEDLEERQYVMKIRSKKDLYRQGLYSQFRRAQVKAMNLPEHPGILPIHALLEDDKFYYVVMEKANESSFFFSLLKDHGDGHMPASVVKHLMSEILEAVAHVHHHGMLHRDIKPDNIVMQRIQRRNGSSTKRAKLIDFDHADPDWYACKEAGVGGNEVFGTLRFNAPEALLGRFSIQSDLFSIGATLYLLMAGSFPYSEELYGNSSCSRTFSTLDARRELHKRLQDSAVDFSDSVWLAQKDCKDFCSWLLAFDPSERPSSADDALQHRWFRCCSR